jgi:hypothetical protein
VSATDYAQVLAADTAANEVDAVSFVGADFTGLLSCDALHEPQLYTLGKGYESSTLARAALQ